MKLIQLLTILTTICTLALANSPPFPIFGPCQKRCISQFGEIKERVSNTDTLYREVDVFNKTEFSLCKLGCNSPEYTDLNLPAFRYGQSAYQQILMNVDEKPSRESIVKDISILCLDNFPHVIKNSTTTTTSKRVLKGKVMLVLDEGVSETENVYFVEVVARDADDDDTYIVYQDWCYSSNCNVSFNADLELTDLEVRLRVSTFDENGAVGGIVLSKWYNINHILMSTSVDMSLKALEWNDDKAAARLSFDEAPSVHVPACSLQMIYQSAVNLEDKRVDFNLDHTRQIILKKLDFNQTYTMRLVPATDSHRPSAALATTRFQVPACRDMVSDMTQCAPPPVSTLASNWNLSSSSGYGLTIEWTYVSDGLVNQSMPQISMSHFMFSVHPLITTNNENCGKYEPIRRDVTYTHRKVLFYVPDAECNYEVEVAAVDTKQRKSDVKKIKILRVNEPTYMSLLLATDIPTSVGLGALVLVTIVIFIFVSLFVIHKRRKNAKNVDDGPFELPPGERMVYAYVENSDSSKTVIGVRPPPKFHFEPVENINRNINAALSHRHCGYDIQTGRTYCHNKHFPCNQNNPIKLPPHMMLRVYPNWTPESPMEMEDTYETIMDYRRCDSELSDEVFEDDSYGRSSYNNYNSLLPMAPIAPIEYFTDLPAYRFQDFQLRKKYETEGNPAWRLNNVVNAAKGTCSTLKYGKDYSNETRAAMLQELNFLRTLPPHPTCVRFDGVVIGKWDNVPYQVIGLLLENCRGGSLRQYIIAVGSILRHQVICRTNLSPPTPVAHDPINETHRNVDGSPSPSSGYDSFSSKDRQTPDRPPLDINHRYSRVSARFCQFAEQIASALEHLHRAGIVHTRVTTYSVYLHREFTDPMDMLCDQMVKLGDFGHAARSADDVVVDQNLQPPEVALGKKYEAKGDIWQFGTCLVEMCSLGIPYQAQKQIPLSGLEDFDKLPSTCVLQDAAKKCLTPRNRPSASDLRGVFQTDTARDIKALDMADQMKQSLLI